jgi:serine phosphatase RsbU (regulator of sigma subunit)
VGSFVALGYLAFRNGESRLSYTLAGQPPPLVRRASGVVQSVAMPDHRLPLGALRTGGHRILEIGFEPGDLMLAYSDGAVEALSPEGEFFGEERLAQSLQNAPPEPQQAIQYVLEEIEAFTCGHTPYDDVTLVAATWSSTT